MYRALIRGKLCMLVWNADMLALQNQLCLTLPPQPFPFSLALTSSNGGPPWRLTSKLANASGLWTLSCPLWVHPLTRTPAISILCGLRWTLPMGFIRLHLSEFLKVKYSMHQRTLLRTLSRPLRMSMPLLESLVHLCCSKNSLMSASLSSRTLCHFWMKLLHFSPALSQLDTSFPQTSRQCSCSPSSLHLWTLLCR